ncbi:acetyl-CoA hydrolase/transferase C-terminal domain-containing protein [Salinisphaera sp. Q1T1-3]|uniref:acetyl-CoA hydrolase/transferase C-terminal domain-containing protein n=1 Tax=Salinisphaera sp. Q1T1-3 TaxID=2321229 RepID=UPI000E72343C|nr:acetyl-CoA hydrolase/transferase C-terminal domain-containing protein [Salinisphaera sp. Q1T1-3]RJS92914.1 acetyl-CoA hydrolase [Salinisphaera sp. Q1T1-3]
MNGAPRPRRFEAAEACIDWLIARVGRRIRVGAPLGLGKPATLMNALYARAKADPTIELTIITALSLNVPAARSDLEARLMNPIIERVFEDYPGLDYLRDVRQGQLPANVTVSEFFFQPGAMLSNDYAQQHYRSVNYTHAARDLLDAGVNVLMQMVAPGTHDDELSLSCNTDVTLDLIPVVRAMRERGQAPLIVGQLNRRLPTMTRSALVPAAEADALFAGEAADFKPFGAPAEAVSRVDYAIAARVTGLIADGGTLQIGIGSLSDAIAWCCGLRQKRNAVFGALLDALKPGDTERALIARYDGRSTFAEGLYGCTEMLVDAYIHLYRDGVITRRVYDDASVQRLINEAAIQAEVTPETLQALIRIGAVRTPLQAVDVEYLKRIGVFRSAVTYRDGGIDPGDGGAVLGDDPTRSATARAMAKRCLGQTLAGPTLVHGGFFLGPNAFYQRLRDLDPAERELFHMTSVGQINHLYGDEAAKRAQRRRARFVNTAIKVSLDGAVAADGLENGRVLSGVGGQYNFVAQAHELADARAIICVRATRQGSDGPESNIVAAYGYNTIPRHLRDIVVTEYGVADLRGATDAEIAAALIEIADARFQDELRATAVAAGKLPTDYRIPAAARDNTPDRIKRVFAGPPAAAFPRYPYGSDLTAVEDTLAGALKNLAGESRLAAVGALARHGRAPDTELMPYLERMGLAEPKGWREQLYARLVSAALRRHGIDKP